MVGCLQATNREQRVDIKPGDTIVVTPHVFVAMIANEMRKAAHDPAAIKQLAAKLSIFAEHLRNSTET
jgi:hypothetical protein